MSGPDAAALRAAWLGRLRVAAAAPSPAPPAGDLDRLPGVGPGLAWALRRAGIARSGDLAGLAPEALVVRLGPLGRLVPAAGWIAAARDAAARPGA